MRDNIIMADISREQTTTDPLYQWDYGQVLKLTGADLPEAYEVHFALATSGEAIVMIGGADGVVIPDQLLDQVGQLHAWLYLHSGDADGETVRHIYTRIIPRAKPGDEEPTPEQQSAIDQAIAALNTGVDRAEDAADAADQSAQDAAESASAASTSATAAATSATNASTSATAAATSATNASTSATAAAGSATTATTKAGEAAQSATSAAQSAQTAADAVQELVDITASADTLPAGSQATATYADGHLTIGVPTGATGATGPQGEKGDPGDDYVLTSADKHEIADLVRGMYVVTVSGTDPVIEAEENTRYVCGEVATLSFTPSATGTCDVIFKSGSTPTVVTLPNTVRMPDWYAIAANRTYEINISEGVYGVVTSWI